MATSSGPGSPSQPRKLIKGGTVLTMDPAIPDLEIGDVLIDNDVIAAVGPDLDSQAAGAEVIDATGMIVMPGFVNTHMHMYHGLLRGLVADDLFDTYVDVVTIGERSLDAGHGPEEMRLGVLIAALAQISAGVTTTIDTSHLQKTPEHRDALIAGLRDSGLRAVFTYWGGLFQWDDWDDLDRVRSQYFSSGDQLLTLALGGGSPDVQVWREARRRELDIVAHTRGDEGAAAIRRAHEESLLGPHATYIHCTHFPDDVFEIIRDTGGSVSIAPAIEMEMGQGLPPIQQSLDHSIQPSLSSDVETNMTGDMFSVMRAGFISQRHEINNRLHAGETGVPPLVTTRDMLQMATTAGARAARLESKVGSLTAGKQADIVVLDAQAINAFPLNAAPQSVVTLMDTSNVRHVLIAGTARKWDGKLVGVDLPTLAAQAQAARDRVFERSGRKVRLV
ncbi:amidohydrolase family protein [Nonomuraea wenchangensis]